MSCGSCLCGVPPVATVDDLPPVGTSGLCEGAMRIVEADGSLWVLVRDATLSPTGNPLRRQWRRIDAGMARDVLLFSTNMDLDASGALSGYMSDSATNTPLMLASLPLRFPVWPNAYGGTVVQLRTYVAQANPSQPFTFAVVLDGTPIAILTTYAAGETGYKQSTALPVAVPVGTHGIDVLLTTTGTDAADNILASAAVQVESISPSL